MIENGTQMRNSCVGIAAMLNVHGGVDSDIVWELDPVQSKWIAENHSIYVRPRSIVPKGVKRHIDQYQQDGYERPNYGISVSLKEWGPKQRLLFSFYTPKYAGIGNQWEAWPVPTDARGNAIDHPKASCKASREPEDIAKFLLRTFIPAMNDYHTSYCESAEKQLRYRKALIETADKLRKVNRQPLDTVRYDHRGLTEQRGSIDVKRRAGGRQSVGEFFVQSPDVVRFDFKLPPSEAEVVLHLLRGLNVGEVGHGN